MSSSIQSLRNTVTRGDREALAEPPRELPAPAPVSGWRRLLVDWCLVGSATLLSQVLGAATSLALRLVLDPAQMGIWQGLKLVLGYANYANLGISKGAVRDYAVALGRGDTTAARRGLDLAFTANTISSLAYGIALIAAAVWLVARGGAWASAWAGGLIAVGAMALLQRHVTFQVTILRAQQDFATTTRLTLLEAGLTLVVGIPAAWLWGLAGLLCGTLAVFVASLAVVQWRCAVRLRPAWNGLEMRRLVRIGAPMLLAGVVYSLFQSLDKLMILAYLPNGEFQLGCYSLALMVVAQLYGLGNMFGIVVGPRLAEKHGQSGHRAETARLAARMSEWIAVAVAVPASLALVAGVPLLAWLLPKYSAGLPSLVWLVPGAVPLALGLPATQYLVTIDRQARNLAVIVVATGLLALANHLALSAGLGLVGVAVATSIGYTAYWLLAVACSIWFDLDGAARLRYMAIHAAVALPPLALAFVPDIATCQPPHDAGTVVLRTTIVLLFWGAMLAIGWRYAGWRAMLRR